MISRVRRRPSLVAPPEAEARCLRENLLFGNSRNRLMISEERSNAADFFVFSVYSSVEIVTGEEFHEPDAGRNGRLVGIEGGCMQFSGSGTDAQAVEDRRVAGAVEAKSSEVMRRGSI